MHRFKIIGGVCLVCMTTLIMGFFILAIKINPAFLNFITK